VKPIDLSGYHNEDYAYRNSHYGVRTCGTIYLRKALDFGTRSEFHAFETPFFVKMASTWFEDWPEDEPAILCKSRTDAVIVSSEICRRAIQKLVWQHKSEYGIDLLDGVTK
jgi:hypothetical protein